MALFGVLRASVSRRVEVSKRVVSRLIILWSNVYVTHALPSLKRIKNRAII